MIDQQQSLVVTVAIVETAGDQKQDNLEEDADDFCDTCVITGYAVQTLLMNLKYKPTGVS